MQNLRRAISFVLLLSLCFAMSSAPAYALIGIRPGTENMGITIDEIVLDMTNSANPGLYVGGKLEGTAAAYLGFLVKRVSDDSDVETGYLNVPAAEPGETNRSYRMEDMHVQEGGLNAGEYYVAVADFNQGEAIGVTPNSYRRYFAVDDNNNVILDPAVRGDYELTASPTAILLDDCVYGAGVSPTAISLQNSGWETLNDVTAVLASGEGLLLSPGEDSPLTELGSGGVQEYAISPDTSLTPGAYSAELQFTAAQVPSASAAAVTVEFNILKATQAAVTGMNTEAASTIGGLGKITNLTAGAAYELGVDPYEEGDWTGISADENGACAVTPGAYQLRLPGNEYYAPGEATEVVVPGFYHFNDATIDDIKAGVPTNWPVCDLVQGGIGSKTYSLAGPGALPEGLTLSTDGFITGEAIAVTDSSFVLQVQVTDENPVAADRVQTGTITIAGITKGDQATPEAISLTESDASVTIDNWNSAQEYAITSNASITEGGLAWKFWGSGDTAAKAFEGLSPNKNYVVFTRARETAVLNPSPITTAAALTLKTTVSSVTISGSGIEGEKLEAVVSPAGATVKYNWKNASGETISTAASILVSGNMAGTEITLEVTGDGDYQGTAETDPWLVGGCQITVVVTSYDPGKPLSALLVKDGDSTTSISAVSATHAGIGAAAQTVTLSGINPNTTYNLVLQKAGHTSLRINGIALGADDLVITSAGTMAELKLYCGDFNGDDAVRLEDRATLLQSRFYGMPVALFDGAEAELAALLDVDGDGYIKLNDMAIVMSAENYGRTGVSIDY